MKRIPVVLLVAVLACSGATLTREEVLDRWAVALGGRENLEKVRAIHLQGSVETGGMKGTFDRWCGAASFVWRWISPAPSAR